MQYVVLFPIQPDQGDPVVPAAAGEAPTLIDDDGLDALFAVTPRETPREERIARLLAIGALAPAEQADDPAVKAKAQELDKAATKMLKEQLLTK